MNPATPGELDNSVNCEPARCAMTVLRSRKRLHRKTTDRSSIRGAPPKMVSMRNGIAWRTVLAIPMIR